MRYMTAPWRERYVQSVMKVKKCVFCQAQKKKTSREAYILFRGKHHFILLNKYPYTTGHMMIAPYEHTAAFESASPDSSAEWAELMKLAVKILRIQYRPHGLNAGMNLGRSAGAGVTGHYHVHIVPRWTGDANFMPLIARTRVLTEDLDTTYERLLPLFEKERTSPLGRRAKVRSTSHMR